MKKLRILLADDHTIVRKGLRSLLEDEIDIEVVAEAQEGLEAIQKAELLRPDIVIMDISMPGINGLEATRQIVKQSPTVRVVVLTMHDDDEYLRQALLSGASGYVIKQAAVADLVDAVRAVYHGDSYLSPSISRKLIDWFVQQGRIPTESKYDELTNREREVLQLVAQGRTTREIANLLQVSVKTVETHRMHVMEKLGLHNLADLTRFAMRKGLV